MKRGVVLSLRYDESVLLAKALTAMGVNHPNVINLALKIPERIYLAAGLPSPHQPPLPPEEA